MKAIVVAGSINIDFVAEAEHIPQAGETIGGRCFETHHGGKGANQAFAVARLDHPAVMIGAVGSDPFSEPLRANLAGAGVDCSAVERVEGSSGVALIARAANGENSIIVVAGANAQLTRERILRHGALIENAALLLLQLETPLDGVACAVEIAHGSGVPVILDPAPAAALPYKLLQRVEWLTPNETEAGILLGWPAAHAALDAAKTAQALLALGSRNVALKLGARGVFLAGASVDPVLVPGIAVRAVDTTAAGDTFDAAFATKLAGGAMPEEAAEYANRAAAISVTRAGAQSSMPSAEEVNQRAGSKNMVAANG
jgi:ribokinase